MKYSTKQLLTCLLAAFMLASCGGKEAPNQTDSTAADRPDTTDTAADGTTDPFADIDYDGKALRISSSNDSTDATNAHRLIAGSDALNGEIVNDAVFHRNETVQEKLNMTLAITPSAWTYGNAAGEIEQLILSGDGQYDVMINDLRILAQLSVSGYFHPVGDTGILNLDGKYWYRDAIEDLTVVPGATYLLLGDYFTDSLSSAHVLYYNKSLIGNHTGSESYVQDMVLAGDWTIDEMIRLKTETAVDLDGNGTLEEGDQFGYTIIGAWGPLVPVLMGLDVRFIENDGGNVRYCFNNERSVKILEKLNELYWTDGTLQNTQAKTTDDLRQKFAGGKTVFVGYLRLSDLENLRDIEFPVGISPYPKLDTAQEHYISSLHMTSEVGSVMGTVPQSDLPFVFTCLEVLGRETAETVMPTYYEEALKVKYVGGTDDAAMIDLIHDTITSPFALAYNQILANFPMRDTFLNPVGAHQTDFASSYAANISAGQAALDELIAGFREHLE